MFIKQNNKIYQIDKEIDKTTKLEELKKTQDKIETEREAKLKEVNDFFDNKKNDIINQINELNKL